MGSSKINRIKTTAERNQCYHHILNDLQAFHIMLRENSIEKRNDRIGAEQELCLVDSRGQPLNVAEKVLGEIDDPHFTHELALFNLEINLDPEEIAPNGLQKMESALSRLLKHGSEVAAKYHASLYLGGILPTIQARHLTLASMTPIERYRALNDLLLELRGRDFEIYLQGVDDFNVNLDSDLFEACNTSFQCHLQVNPDHFVHQYNWAQMIAGPVLSSSTNSPLLFGRELWAENRIAVFKQSLDTRDLSDFTRINTSRVHFGIDWVKESPIEIWKQAVSRFPILFHRGDLVDSLSMLNRGEMPKLTALQLHNGTTYAWNRLCYGVKENISHIRLECRYLPAGPTVADEFANFAFWLGLMKSQPIDGEPFWEKIDFRVAKDNFIRAARTGIHSVFEWFGERVTAKKLLLDKLLPMAALGLQNAGMTPKTVDKYLEIIESRVRKSKTGSEWATKNARSLRKKYRPTAINGILVNKSVQNQRSNIPIHEWSDIRQDEPILVISKVEDVMQVDIRVVADTVNVEFARAVMQWMKIHHLPVEDHKRNLVGLLSWEDLERHAPTTNIRQIIPNGKPSIGPTASLSTASERMQELDKKALLVIENDRLIGIITKTDLDKCMADF